MPLLVIKEKNMDVIVRIIIVVAVAAIEITQAIMDTGKKK